MPEGGAKYYEADGSPVQQAMQYLQVPRDIVASGGGTSEYSDVHYDEVVQKADNAPGMYIDVTEEPTEQSTYVDFATLKAMNSGPSAPAPAPAPSGARLRKFKADYNGVEQAVVTWLASQPGGDPGQGNKALVGSYRLEGMDRKHRMGDVLRVVFASWRKMGKGMGFMEFCDSLKPGEVARIFLEFYKFLGYDASIIAREQRKSVLAFYHGVEYMDALTRKSSRLRVVGDTAMYNGKPFDTKDMSTVFSGPGFCIFVMSPAGKFYVGSHVKGELHHSSFLGGAPVRAAGEMVASNGRITMISGKSGHYQPSMEHLVAAVQRLAELGLPIRNAKVRLYRKGPDGKPLMNNDGNAKDAFTGNYLPLNRAVPVYVSGWEFLSGDAKTKHLAFG